MNFLCNDSVSVSSIKRNDENIIICGFFVYNQSKFQIELKSKLEKTDFDRNFRVVLIQLTVVLYWGDMCLVEWISVHSELMWTIPLGYRSIEKRFNKKYCENVFVTTPVTFYYNFTKNHDFDDLGNAVMIWGGIFCI